MGRSQLYIEDETSSSSPPKWWYRRWIKIIGICFIFLIILIATLALIFKFYGFTPQKSETTTTTTLISTATTTTTQKSGKFQNSSTMKVINIFIH